MMRGPTYDDNYISRKMHSFQSAPTFCPPACGPSSYDYMQADAQPEPDDHSNHPHDDWLVNPENPPRNQLRPGHIPSGQTRLILNRIGLGQAGSYAPRLTPRMGPPPSYYDYDYGGGYGYGGYGGYGSGFGGYGGYRPYGGYGGYGYCPPPRYSYRNYDALLDDDHDVNYIPRYRPGRIAETLSEIEKKELRPSLSPIRDLTTTTRTCTTTGSPSLPTEFMARNYSPGMLQEQVDKMRTRLQAMAFSLDPSGPVPEIIIPERSKRVESGKEFSKKYSSALEMAELPRLSARKQQHTYPEDDYMKDNLRIKCLSHYKTTRTAAEYWKPKGYYGDEVGTSYTLPSYTSKYASSKSGGASGGGAPKWEEPDTVYSKGGEVKPFSKVETGSSFFSTYGYTNRLKDTVAEKVRDYYYDKDAPKTTEGDDDDLKKERRKKKRSKEREEPPAIDSGSSAPTSATVPSELSAETAAGDAGDASVGGEEPELDEKERKRLEKKKRKAEREAAAKAAMEAELAALAEAEAELARLEAESSSLKSSSDTKPEPAPAAPQPPAESSTPAQEEKASETVTEKCESTIEAPCEVLPECPPTKSECDPTPLTSSSAQVAEGEESRRKEESVSQPPKDESHQDLSAEKPALESEPAEQVTQNQDSPQDPKEGEPEIASSVDDATGPIVEDSDFFELKPSLKTEFHLSLDPVEAATSDHSGQAPVAEGDDNYEQQIGGGEVSLQSEEEQQLEDRWEIHHEKKGITPEQEEIQYQLTQRIEEPGEEKELDSEPQFQSEEEVPEHHAQEPFEQVPQTYLGQQISDQFQEHPIEEQQLENTREQPEHTMERLDITAEHIIEQLESSEEQENFSEQPEHTIEQSKSAAEQENIGEQPEHTIEQSKSAAEQENIGEQPEHTTEQENIEEQEKLAEHLEEDTVAKIQEIENKDEEFALLEDSKLQELDSNIAKQDECTHVENREEHFAERDDSNNGQIQKDLEFEDIFAGRED